MEEHKFFNFLSKHWSKLLLGILALATLAVWGERLFSSKKATSHQDFLVCRHIFERFQKGEPLADESLQTAEKILKRHPELLPSYNMMLAMTYLSARNPSKGIPYIQEALKEAPPLYQNYAKTSVLIAEKDYQEAYKEALDLHILFKNPEEKNSMLCAFNLLRLVSLEKELGAKPTSWEELKAHPAYPSIKPLFQEGNVTIEHLIN